MGKKETWIASSLVGVTITHSGWRQPSRGLREKLWSWFWWLWWITVVHNDFFLDWCLLLSSLWQWHWSPLQHLQVVNTIEYYFLPRFMKCSFQRWLLDVRLSLHLQRAHLSPKHLISLMPSEILKKLAWEPRHQNIYLMEPRHQAYLNLQMPGRTKFLVPMLRNTDNDEKWL